MYGRRFIEVRLRDGNRRKDRAVPEIELIDRNRLIEELRKLGSDDIQAVLDVIWNQPVIAVARRKYEIEVFA